MSRPKAVVFGSHMLSLLNFRKQLLIDLSERGFDVIAMAPGHDKEIESELGQLGIQYMSVDLSRTGFNPLADIRSFLHLKRTFRSLNPDILLTYTIKPNIYGTWACDGMSVKKVAWITGLGFVGMPPQSIKGKLVRKIVLFLYHRSLRNLEYIAFQNPDDQQFFEKYGLISKKTKQTITAGSGVDLLKYQRSEPVTDQVKFLLVARLIKAKGVNEFLDAAEQMKKKYNDKVSFDLVGMLDPTNPDSIEIDRIETLNSSGIISYHGEQRDVRPFISSSSVFVLPSFYREGTPRTILEAMAMGKPIITTDNPGCRETVNEGVNGFLVTPKSVEELFNAMAFFVENVNEIIKMGKESYQMARDKYDVHQVNKNLLSFIEV